MTMIKVQSSDAVMFTVDLDVVKISATITTEYEAVKDDEEIEFIPLGNVNSVILRKIFQWGEHHKGKTEAEPNDQDPWVIEFLEVDPGTLFELIVAADNLKIPGLQSVTCRKVAGMLKGKTPEEIREQFGIAASLVGFTPEEEAQIRKENEWCEQK